MELFVKYCLYVHIVVGCIALISGAIAILSKKGQELHRRSGRVYFLAMTLVFITGVFVASYIHNWFLILIAFLSYYSVFCGIRILRLKELHKNQSPKWYDWAAGIVNGFANIIFLGVGLLLLFNDSVNISLAFLSIGFGIGGLILSYANLKPFLVKPHKAYHWYISHIGNMMGGYIATFTAFLSTMVTRFELMNPFLAFALPSLIGIPLLLLWTRKVENSFSKQQTK